MLEIEQASWYSLAFGGVKIGFQADLELKHLDPQTEVITSSYRDLKGDGRLKLVQVFRVRPGIWKLKISKNQNARTRPMLSTQSHRINKDNKEIFRRKVQFRHSCKKKV